MHDMFLGQINVENKVYKKTVISDVVTHLKQQKFNVSLDL